jgi:predicted nucleotidyltransferase
MPISSTDLLSLRERVRWITRNERFSLDDLLSGSADVIVFGSRAAGLERVDSDLDILAIGPLKLPKKKGLIDLICVSEPDAHTLAWQHSEIFRHVEAYGISLMHERALISVVVDEHAANRKRHRIEILIPKLMESWDALNDGYKAKYLTKMRREFQRYRLLDSGLPVPPTAVLDSQIESQRAFESALEAMLQEFCKDSARNENARRLFLNEAFRLRGLLAGNTGIIASK